MSLPPPFSLQFLIKNNQKIAPESSGPSLPPFPYNSLLETIRKSLPRALEPPSPLFLQFLIRNNKKMLRRALDLLSSLFLMVSYIYIYIQRERERETECLSVCLLSATLFLSVCLSVCLPVCAWTFSAQLGREVIIFPSPLRTNSKNGGGHPSIFLFVLKFISLFPCPSTRKGGGHLPIF